jgi:hypothetical protein
MLFGMMDRICISLIYFDAFALPIIAMYCLSSNQTMNWIIGFIIGAIGAWWVQGKVLKLDRIWIYCTAIIMTVITLLIVVKLTYKI